MLVDRKGQTVDEKRIKEDADGLNWDALKDECTRDKIWKDMSGKDIAKNFAIVFLLGLLPTVFDLATDSLSIRDFIAGTVYVKHINSMAIFNTTNTGGCTVHSAQCTVHSAHSLTTFPTPLERFQRRSFLSWLLGLRL